MFHSEIQYKRKEKNYSFSQMHFVKWLKIQINANLFITVSQLQVAFVCQQQF